MSQNNAENDAVDRAICKFSQALNNDNTPKDDGVPNEDPKSDANAGSSFGKTNKLGNK